MSDVNLDVCIYIILMNLFPQYQNENSEAF